MEQIILIFHFVFCLALIGLVLLQKGKGAGMGSAFGSGASSTVFGSKGSGGFLMKFTIGIAALFFITSISLTYIAAHQSKQAQSSGNLVTQVEQIAQIQKQETNTQAPAAPLQTQQNTAAQPQQQQTDIATTTPPVTKNPIKKAVKKAVKK